MRFCHAVISIRSYSPRHEVSRCVYSCLTSCMQTIREKQGAFLQVRSVYQQKVAAEASRAGQSGVPSQ